MANWKDSIRPIEAQASSEATPNREPSKKKTWKDTIAPIAKPEESSTLGDAAKYIGETVEDTGYGALEGATLGFRDEILARARQAGLSPNDLKRMGRGALGMVAGPLGSIAGMMSVPQDEQPTPDISYEDALKEQKAIAKQASDRSPVATTLGEIGGAVALPMGEVAALGKLPLVAKLPQLLQKGVQLAPAAAGMGALATVGKSEKPISEIPVSDVATGAALGGAAGLAAPAIGAGVGKVLSKGAELGGKAVGLAKDVVESVPLVREFGEQFSANKRGFDTLSQEGREAITNNAIQHVEGPAKATSETITKTQLVPEQEALNKLSGELGQQMESGVSAQARDIERRQVQAAAKFLNRIEGLGEEAGAIVGQLKKEVIDATPEAKTGALKAAVTKLEDIINKSPSLKADPKAIEVLNAYRSEISEAPVQVQKVLSRTSGPDMEPITKEAYKAKGPVSPEQAENLFESAEYSKRTGAELIRAGEKETVKTMDLATAPGKVKALATPQEYFQFVDDMGALANSKQLEGTPLSAALKQARKEAVSMGRDELYGPQGDPIRQIFDEANQVYSAKLKLQDTYNIDFSNPAEAQSKVLSYMNAISASTKPEAAKAAMLQGFLDDIRKVEPKLADEFMETFSGLKAQGEALPQVPTQSKIQSAFMESPQSQQALQEIKDVGKTVLPQDSLNEAIAKGESSAVKIQQYKEDLKKLNFKEILGSIQNSSNPANLKANVAVRDFINVIKKVDPAAAEALSKDPQGLLQAAEAAANMAGEYGDFVGVARRGSRIAGALTGKLSKSIADLLPQDYQMLTQKATQAGKTEAAKYFQQLANAKDQTARNALLYMISQQAGLKRDINELAGIEGQDGQVK